MDANSREATQAKIEVPTAKPSEMLYCILHEGTFKAELGVCGLGHVVMEGDTLEFCCFPDGYTFCPPQEEVTDLSEDWMEQPDDELDNLPGEEIEIWLGGME